MSQNDRTISIGKRAVERAGLEKANIGMSGTLEPTPDLRDWGVPRDIEMSDVERAGQFAIVSEPCERMFMVACLIRKSENAGTDWSYS